MSKKSLIPGLKQALDHDPKNEFLRLLLIEEYLKDHFWDQASQEVETLLSQNPLSIAALWALAQVKEAKKLFSESIVI
jgi:hypothetical protein